MSQKTVNFPLGLKRAVRARPPPHGSRMCDPSLPTAVPPARGRGPGPPAPHGRAGVHRGRLPGGREGGGRSVLRAHQAGGLHRLRAAHERGPDPREAAPADRGTPGLPAEEPAVGPRDPALPR